MEAQSRIVVRERHYPYDDAVTEYYDSGNVVLTHEWNALALIIPPGERAYIRDVQRLASRVKDPELQQQIKAFIGQEAMHSKETNRFLEPLEKRGFPIRQFNDWFDGILRWGDRFPFPRIQLACAAAGEHWTAACALWLLRTGYTDRFPPAIRDLWRWHGAEEVEHRAVVFNQLQAVAPRNYLMRLWGFIVTLGLIWLGYTSAMRMLLKQEGLSRAQIREERRKARKIRIPIFSLWFPHLLAYLRPGFHPNDLDDGGLAQQVLAEQAAGGKS